MSRLTIADVKVCRDGYVVRRSDGQKIGEVDRPFLKWQWRIGIGNWSADGYDRQTDALAALLDRVKADA